MINKYDLCFLSAFMFVLLGLTTKFNIISTIGTILSIFGGVIFYFLKLEHLQTEGKK